MSGETVCSADINMSNAQDIMDWVRDTDSHHTAADCKSKDCVHAPGAMTVDWAATLIAEAAVVCTCGEHGVDDTAESATIVRDFHRRWS